MSDVSEMVVPEVSASRAEGRRAGKKRIGRPRKLDEVKRREICALVSAGCSVGGAAHYVGCSPITVLREARRNPEFLKEMRKATVNSEITPLQAMQRAAATHWRAAAWLLERSRPEEFAAGERDMMSLGRNLEAIEQIVRIIGREVKDSATRKRIYREVKRLSADYARRDQMEDRLDRAARQGEVRERWIGGST